MRPPGAEGPRTHRFQTCLTTQEVFSQHHGACPGLTYHRIPVPDFCAPREEVRGPGRRGLGRKRSPPPPPGLGLGCGHSSAEGLGAYSTRVQLWLRWFIHIPSRLGVCMRACVCACVCTDVCLLCIMGVYGGGAWLWRLWYMCVCCGTV